MKTILVVYSNNKSLTKNQVNAMKHYAFNTESDLKVGDVIVSSAYDTAMHIVRVLEDSFKYYNATTGELTDKFTSTSLREVKTLVIREDDVDTVYGSIVKQD